MHLNSLRTKSTEELRELASDAGAPCSNLRRHELLVEVLKDLGHKRQEIRAEGVLEVLGDGFGFLRFLEEHFHPGSEDVYVSPSQIRRFSLRTGDSIAGVIRAPKDGERYLALLRVDQVNGLDPDARLQRDFDHLVAEKPSALLPLKSNDPAVKLATALAPLGRGQRCLVYGDVSASSRFVISLACDLADQDDLEVIAVLLDARPEIAASLSSRAVPVLAAPMSEPPMRVVQLCEVAFSRARRLVELGADVVLAVNSLSALERATADVAEPGTPRWAPLAAVKALLAAAHACSGGGSLTLIASIGQTPGLQDEVLAYANAQIAVVRRPDGAIAVLPLATWTEDPSDLLAPDAARELAAARNALAKSPDGVAHAMDRARSCQSADDLRRTLAKAD